MKEHRIFNPITRHRRVALVGMGSAGKSVFLTSLLDHINHHEPERFALDSPGEGEERLYIKRPRELALPDSLERFPYERSRRMLAEQGEWPDKTGKIYGYRVCFNLSNKLQRRPVALDFLDFPGERMADTTMFRSSYEEWSDWLLSRHYLEIPGAEGWAEDYVAVSEGDTVTDDEVVRQYKVFLGRLLKKNAMMICPSTFWLDLDGTQPSRDGDVDSWADFRVSGTGKDCQFAPLTATARSKHPNMHKSFKRHYEKYRKSIPDKIFSRLRKCHQLVVLADVPGLLNTNTRCYTDTLAAIGRFLNVCNPKKGMILPFIKTISPGAFRPGGIERIIAVATKSDMVKRGQVDRLRDLLKQMFGECLRDFDQQKEWFTCSAAISTQKSSDAKYDLLGHLIYGPDGAPQQPPRESDTKALPFAVSDLPTSWPEEWDERDFTFPEVYPRVALRTPPRQENLDRILRLLLDI